MPHGISAFTAALRGPVEVSRGTGGGPGPGRPAGPPREAGAFLHLGGVSKRFGAFKALDDINLDVREGEFVCFLGPSGCGKSTLLRIIAGLVRQDAGRILSEGIDISGLPPGQRQFGIVFQSYALFPNLDVRANIAYGLHNRKMPRAAVEARLAELLELVDLAGSERKLPSELSGGQQQRVALARAIAPAPRLLLLDEPLSALDAKVRIHLRRQIRALQTRLGVTTIMVTHDQDEAMSMGDRIVAMNHGTVEQVGTPRDIYLRPRSPFVAGFVGRMNMFDGTLGGGRLRIGDVDLPAPPLGSGGASGRDVTACLRPEQIRFAASGGEDEVALPAEVASVEFLGSVLRVTLSVPSLASAPVVVDVAGEAAAGFGGRPGGAVTVVIPSACLMVFSKGLSPRNLTAAGSA